MFSRQQRDLIIDIEQTSNEIISLLQKNEENLENNHLKKKQLSQNDTNYTSKSKNIQQSREELDSIQFLEELIKRNSKNSMAQVLLFFLHCKPFHSKLMERLEKEEKKKNQNANKEDRNQKLLAWFFSATQNQELPLSDQRNLLISKLDDFKVNEWWNVQELFFQTIRSLRNLKFPLGDIFVEKEVQNCDCSEANNDKSFIIIKPQFKAVQTCINYNAMKQTCACKREHLKAIQICNKNYMFLVCSSEYENKILHPRSSTDSLDVEFGSCRWKCLAMLTDDKFECLWVLSIDKGWESLTKHASFNSHPQILFYKKI